MEREFFETEDGVVEVLSDGTTVWINRNGRALGRFGEIGYEFYFSDASCCIWNGNTYNLRSWTDFIQYLSSQYGIKVSLKHLPVKIFKNEIGEAASPMTEAT